MELNKIVFPKQHQNCGNLEHSSKFNFLEFLCIWLGISHVSKEIWRSLLQSIKQGCLTTTVNVPDSWKSLIRSGQKDECTSNWTNRACHFHTVPLYIYREAPKFPRWDEKDSIPDCLQYTEFSRYISEYKRVFTTRNAGTTFFRFLSSITYLLLVFFYSFLL